MGLCLKYQVSLSIMKTIYFISALQQAKTIKKMSYKIHLVVFIFVTVHCISLISLISNWEKNPMVLFETNNFASCACSTCLSQHIALLIKLKLWDMVFLWFYFHQRIKYVLSLILYKLKLTRLWCFLMDYLYFSGIFLQLPLWIKINDYCFSLMYNTRDYFLYFAR